MPTRSKVREGWNSTEEIILKGDATVKPHNDKESASGVSLECRIGALTDADVAKLIREYIIQHEGELLTLTLAVTQTASSKLDNFVKELAPMFPNTKMN